MTMRRNARAGTFLFCCLALLLATGLYQRVANPSLEHHLRHSPASMPEKPIPTSSPAPGLEKPVPFSPADAETLAKAMKELRDTPNNPDIHRRIAEIFLRYNDQRTAAKFLERAAALAANPQP